MNEWSNTFSSYLIGPFDRASRFLLHTLDIAVLNDHTDLFLLFNDSLPFLLWAASAKYSTHLLRCYRAWYWINNVTNPHCVFPSGPLVLYFHVSWALSLIKIVYFFNVSVKGIMMQYIFFLNLQRWWIKIIWSFG